METQVRTRLAIGGRLVLGILLLLLSLPAAAQSGPITTQSLFFDQASNAHSGNYLDAQAGLIYTDNATLSQNGSGDVLAMIGLVGNTERLNAPRFDYHLDSDITLVKYLKNAYATQPFGYLDGFGEFKIFPGTLSWIGRETFSQVLLNSTAPATPDNLESLNYATTGPQLTLKPTLRTTIIVDATYSYVYSSSKSPEYVNIDDHRYGGDAKIQRAFSNTLSAFVSGSYQKVRFTDTVVNTDFTYQQGEAGFTFGDARTILEASGGYTRAHLDGPPAAGFPIPRTHFGPPFLGAAPTIEAVPTNSADQNPSGTDWRVSLSRVISPTQRVALHAFSQVTDAANLFRLNLDQPVPGNGQNLLATGQPFTHREYGGSWRFDNGRTSLELSALEYSDHYQTTPNSNINAKQVNALIARHLNASLNWDLGLTYEHDDFGSGFASHTVNAITSVRWRVGPKIGLRFLYAHSSQSPNGYQDNQIGVTASYALTTGAKATDNQLKPYSPASQPFLH